jgi:hypothetical protein
MALEAKAAARNHLPEEALENYAFGRLPRAQLDAFEEHLLLCGHCQERLDTEDHFASAMLAMAALESPSADPPFLADSSSSWAARVRGSRDAWDGPGTFAGVHSAGMKLWRPSLWAAGMAVILTIGLGTAIWFAPNWFTPKTAQTAEIVELKTLRGDGVAEAGPNRPLELSIDFGEIGLGEMAKSKSGPFRLEVVDAAGRQVWTGAEISFVSSRMETRVEKRLAPGIYWVRLYARSGKLLREFGLRVG